MNSQVTDGLDYYIQIQIKFDLEGQSPRKTTWIVTKMGFYHFCDKVDGWCLKGVWSEKLSELCSVILNICH